MPADTTIPQAPSRHHGDASAPYPCSTAATPPGAAWSIDYGFCRTSLDWHGRHNPQGQGDPRCPRTCPHKAPSKVAVEFGQRFARDGAVAAAAWAAEQRAALLIHPRLRSSVARAILEALKSCNYTSAGLHFATGIPRSSITHQIVNLRDARIIHIADWEFGDSPNPTAIYALGDGKDAPKPAATSLIGRPAAASPFDVLKRRRAEQQP